MAEEAGVGGEEKKERRPANRFDPVFPQPFKVGEKEIVPLPYRPVYNIDQYLVKLLGEDPFFGGVLLQCSKLITRSIPRAAVSYFDGSFTIMFNPDYIGQLEKDNRIVEIMSAIKHELYHVILNHLTSRRFGKHNDTLSNWAHDMAINSLIVHDHGGAFGGGIILPGLRPGLPMDVKKDPLSPEEEAMLALPPDEVQLAVMNAPKLQSSEFYFNLLAPHAQQIALIDLSGGDDHSFWGDVEDPIGAAEAAKAIVANAIKHADARGWGSVKAEAQRMIRQLYAREVDWREQFREWNGNQYFANERFSTRRRHHRKYGLMFPGTRKGRGIRAACCVDMSGSVSDEALALIAAEVAGMGEVVSVTLVPFDHEVATEHVREWDAGEPIVFDRVRMGGTSFQAPTDWVNADGNRDRFDVMWVLTDGECSKPGPSRVPRCWLVVPGHKMMFDTEETVIAMKGGGEQKAA